jgi:hypothetical protein
MYFWFILYKHVVFKPKPCSIYLYSVQEEQLLSFNCNLVYFQAEGDKHL